MTFCRNLVVGGPVDIGPQNARNTTRTTVRMTQSNQRGPSPPGH